MSKYYKLIISETIAPEIIEMAMGGIPFTYKEPPEGGTPCKILIIDSSIVEGTDPVNGKSNLESLLNSLASSFSGYLDIDKTIPYVIMGSYEGEDTGYGVARKLVFEPIR